jgi:hypothetical protein
VNGGSAVIRFARVDVAISISRRRKRRFAASGRVPERSVV